MFLIKGGSSNQMSFHSYELSNQLQYLVHRFRWQNLETWSWLQNWSPGEWSWWGRQTNSIAKPMMVSKKDTPGQPCPGRLSARTPCQWWMSVRTPPTRPCLRWLSSWPTTKRRPPLVPSLRVPMRSQDHLCYALVLIIKQKYFCVVLIAKVIELAQVFPLNHRSVETISSKIGA